MKLLVGLGNPGTKFTTTRHNFGQLFIRTAAKRLGVHLAKQHNTALVGTISLSGQRVVLAIPLCYMNESGIVIRTLCATYKMNIRDCTIAYDDIDLAFGTIRLSCNRTSGGHRGIQSILNELGSSDFTRIRLGIGPYAGNVAAYVLRPWTKEQKAHLPFIINTAYDAMLTLIEKGLPSAASRYNKKSLM